MTVRTISKALSLLARPEVRRGLRRCFAALGGPLGRDDDPGRGDPRRDLRRRRGGRPGPEDHLGQPGVSSADRFGDRRSVGCPFYQALGQPEILGPGPVPVHVGGRLEGAGQHGDEDRRQPLPPAHGDAGLRRDEHADAPDRPDPRDDRRDPAAAQGRRHPRGGRRARRPDARGARRDGGRRADRPAQVQHRAAT